MTSAATASVTFDPKPASWRGLIQSQASLGAKSQTFRAQLGLPTNAPLILTGHQATIWHPGILAKYLAAEAAAQTLGAMVAWVVVDQDERDFGALDIPVATDGGLLRRVSIRLAPPPPLDAASASCPAFDPLDPAGAMKHATPPSVAPGVANVVARLRAHRDASNAAGQVAGAVADLIAELTPRRQLVFATSLSGTDLMRELVDRMRREPREMAAAYNRAAALHPDARIAPLKVDGSRVELPLWRLRASAPRERIWSDAPAAAEPRDIAPRALLMTGLLRMAGCELFIHGTGGGVYDKVTEAWFQDWLGVSVAPTVVVSADLALPLSAGTVTARDVADAKWRAYRAMHDPSMVGDDAAAAQKRQWLNRILGARDAGENPRPFYQQMHRDLKDFKSRHAAALAALRDDAERIERNFANSAIASERTWAFPLHAQENLRRLRDQVFAAFGLGSPKAAPATSLSST